MEDTMNYLQKHPQSKSLQKAELLLQKKNPYKIKFTNLSSTRQPKTTYVESSNFDEYLKIKNIVEVEVATTKKSSLSSYCSMKKTNNCSKYHTNKNKKKERNNYEIIHEE